MTKLPILLLTLASAACARGAADVIQGEGYAAPGEPLPGLDATRLGRFQRGRDLFHHEFTDAEGLGPLYNQHRCSSCHDLPALGGYGAEHVTKATHWDEANQRCDLLEAEGGDVIQQRATAALLAHGGKLEAIPADATEQASITPPSLYGLGLVEAIPENEIAARADSADSNHDGISGRVGRDATGHIGRFGRRAEFVSLRDFIAEALIVEMGLTTTIHPEEEKVNGRPLPAGVDPAPDPEIPDSALALITDFVRYLAVPERAAVTGAAADTVRRGERAFLSAGCASCHVPIMKTGPSDVPVLDRKNVALYSDLLLHDLGHDMNSICGRGAAPSELRTAPLMGLRLRQPFMHNSAARNLDIAIQLHGGEAAASSRAFEGMDLATRAALLRFLRTL